MSLFMRASCDTNPSMDALPANRTWQPPCSHGTYQHEVITSRSRQLLMMGTWLPETCWATIRRQIKYTKVTSSWVFLSTLNYDARSTTHQIYYLRYEPIHGRTTCQPVLTTFLQPRHIPTRGYNITQSSAPEDGHMVARNMLSNY